MWDNTTNPITPFYADQSNLGGLYVYNPKYEKCRESLPTHLRLYISLSFGYHDFSLISITPF